MTNSACSVEMFGDTIPAAVEDIETAPIDVLFAHCIVNPHLVQR